MDEMAGEAPVSKAPMDEQRTVSKPADPGADRKLIPNRTRLSQGKVRLLEIKGSSMSTAIYLPSKKARSLQAVPLSRRIPHQSPS